MIKTLQKELYKETGISEFNSAKITELHNHYLNNGRPFIMTGYDNVLLNEFGCLFVLTQDRNDNLIKGFIKVTSFNKMCELNFNLVNTQMQNNIIRINNDSGVVDIDVNKYDKFKTMPVEERYKLLATIKHNKDYVNTLYKAMEPALRTCVENSKKPTEKDLIVEKLEQLKDKIVFKLGKRYILGYFNDTEFVLEESSGIGYSVFNNRMNYLNNKSGESADTYEMIEYKFKYFMKSLLSNFKNNGLTTDIDFKYIISKYLTNNINAEGLLKLILYKGGITKGADFTNSRTDEMELPISLRLDKLNELIYSLTIRETNMNNFITNPTCETKNRLSEYKYVGDVLSLESYEYTISMEVALYVTKFNTERDMARIVNADRIHIIRTIIRMVNRGELKVDGKHETFDKYKLTQYRVVGGAIIITLKLKNEKANNDIRMI